MGRAAVWNGSDDWQGRRLHLQHLRFILFRLVPVCRCKVVLLLKLSGFSGPSILFRTSSTV
jgi:hypothetical protein